MNFTKSELKRRKLSKRRKIRKSHLTAYKVGVVMQVTFEITVKTTGVASAILRAKERKLKDFKLSLNGKAGEREGYWYAETAAPWTNE